MADAIPADRAMLSLKEVALITGMSPDFLKGQVAAGRLRARRTGPNGGGHYKFRRDDIDAWFDSLEVA